MVKELRSVLRNIDQAMVKGELKKVFASTMQSINEFDKEKMHNESIEILVKLIDYDKIVSTRVMHQELLAHLMIRYILNGDIDKAKSINFLKDLKLPICDLAKTILDEHIIENSSPYILHSIETKSIFGDYTSITHVPALQLDNEDDILRILEDYFPNGKYIANIMERETLLQHSKKVDIGNSEETNIVENRRVYRLN
ncbi:MAG: hypothetical protein GPJ54_22465 [Candidatus Heimdallarchaeota archaeon]|nr:hypothetical protein [Candidatus Heimdallarchaeota archaeon]